MSRRSQLKREKKKEALRARAEQQAALKQGTGVPPSIAQLVLQRMGHGVIQQIDLAVSNGSPEKPTIKVTPAPSGTGMPTVEAPVSKEWPENWPVCPKTCDLMEWRRALENKEYYELKEIEGEGKKPWFQYPRYAYQYSEFVYCTPEMMEALLAHMPVNRPCKDPWVEAIARDVENERWIQSHESIAVNKNGDMHDGQHRARGVIKAGRGWPIYITWNVPPEAIYITDSGDKRKINEKLGLLFPDSKAVVQKTAALCRSMMWGLTSRGIRYSESEIAEFAVKHHEVILWITSHLRSYRADLQAVIAKALLWWGESVVGPFIVRLTKLRFTGDGDPAKALYLWLQKAKQEGRHSAYANPLVYYKKTLAAIYAAAANKDAKKIYKKENDIFEWKGGWEVPPDAPCGGVSITGETSFEDDDSDDDYDDDSEE